ncbi:imidazole glycerol phosphate synthase subunit HisH [Magnetococcales bacterium HHB-1]
MITLIDYGSGNLRSVAKALEKVGGKVAVSSKIEKIRQADHLILPGVGAFADCYDNLQQAKLIEPILEHIQSGKPFLGICVGMQLLFSKSYEFGQHEGFDLIPGKVLAFDRSMTDPEDQQRLLKVPHMGWNRVSQTKAHPLWRSIPDKSHFYFVHSFFCKPEKESQQAGLAEYGIPFAASVAKENIFATQFHPEKSQTLGLRLLENFIHWNP